MLLKDALLSYRITNGLTQEQAAKAAELPRETINRVERGSCLPSDVRLLGKLQRLLHATINPNTLEVFPDR